MLENINDALIECVKAIGGSKLVGPRLWPEKDVDGAQRYLLDCLNPDRPNHKLSPEHVVLILRIAREKGCHIGIHFLCETLAYSEPHPIEPKDELADLLRQYLAARAAETRKDERLDRLIQQHLGIRSVA